MARFRRGYGRGRRRRYGRRSRRRRRRPRMGRGLYAKRVGVRL